MVTYIIASREGGGLRLRIEDLDKARCKSEHINQLLFDLEYFGFSWNGPIVYQSERTKYYQEALDELASQGLIYPCFCSRADLHAASAPHFGEEVVYAGTCRNLSDRERNERSLRRASADRLKVTSDLLSFDDRFQGALSFDLSRCSGDFIVRRSDGVFSYQLAVVVDDAAMGVTDVVRGADLVSSTPRQIYLQSLLGYPHPSYAHIPLIVDREGRRLAKRLGDMSLSYLIDDRKERPASILGRIAYRCGLIECDEPTTLDELVRFACLEALNGKTSITWD